MKIVHLNTEKGWRGGERQTLLLAKELARRGYESWVACRPGKPLEFECQKAGLKVFPISPIMELDPLAAWRLKSFLLEKGDECLLHAHAAHAVGLGALSVKGTGIPFLATRRVDFPIHMNPFSRWKYRSLSGLVAISSRVREMALRAGIPSERLSVIPSGIDPSDYPSSSERDRLRKEKGYGLEERFVVNVAALAPHKDQTTLLNAAKVVLEETRSVRFLFLGEGESRHSLEELARRLNIADRASFLGYRKDVLDYIALADVFVLCSVEEGLGTSLLDALAIGVPTVATRAGGIPEVYESSDAPELVPPRDPASLAKALLWVLGDKEEAVRRVHRGRERVKKFTVSGMTDRYETIYKDLIGKHA